MRSIIDLNGDADLETLKEEAAHRTDKEDKRLELEERRIVVAEANAKKNQNLMRALLSKLG